MNLNLIALAVTAIAAVCLGIAVYQRNPDRVWNRLFAIHATGGGVWTFLNYMIMTSSTGDEAGIYLRLTHPIVAMVICTVVDFAWVFPERIDYADTGRRVGLYAVGAVMGMVAFAPTLYHSIDIEPGVVNVIYGWAFIPFGLFTVVALGYADLVLLGKAIRLEGVQRVQVIWVLVGLAGSHIIASVAIIIIPLIWGTTAYSGWGAGGYIVTLIGMGYAIAKHRLIRPEIALRRVASIVMSAGIVLGVGIATVRQLEPALVSLGVSMNLSYIAVGLAMGALISVLHVRVSRLMRRVLSVGTELPTIHAETASHILRTLDADQLLHYLARALNNALEPTSTVVYAHQRHGEKLVPKALIDGRNAPSSRTQRSALAPSHRLIKLVTEEGGLITRDQVFRFAALEDARELAREMEEMDAQVVAPMVWEDKLIGLVMLGSKLSGDMYGEEDLRFVSDMALQSSLALRNAELYAETASLKDFNESILRQMDNAVVVTNAEEKIVAFNEAAERLFGIPSEQALGQTTALLPEGVARSIRASLESGRILPSQQCTFERGDRQVPLACSTSPLAGDGDGDGDGSQGAVAVISDLTLIQELDRERQEAERLSLIRVISAGMAHEIRNPLVAIRTFAELAPQRLDDPEFRNNFLTVAQQEIARIDKLVGDLLTLSKPADAVVELVEINELCRQVVRATAGLAEAKELRVECETPTNELWVSGDTGRLYQALLNLVSNAVHAEPTRGLVRLRAESAHVARRGQFARVIVHNAGSYIPIEQRDDIFRPFVSTRVGGTGLGLAICQTIIEEHSGRITVYSNPETGTDFVLELPLSEAGAHMTTPDET